MSIIYTNITWTYKQQMTSGDLVSKLTCIAIMFHPRNSPNLPHSDRRQVLYSEKAVIGHVSKNIWSATVTVNLHNFMHILWFLYIVIAPWINIVWFLNEYVFHCMLYSWDSFRSSISGIGAKEHFWFLQNISIEAHISFETERVSSLLTQPPHHQITTSWSCENRSR